MYRMASLCASLGQRVLLSTTTHIRIPVDGSYVQGMEAVKERWSQGQYAVVGSPCAEGKLSMLPLKQLNAYISEADIVFLEADGAKELPLKVPSGNEPVLLPQSDLLVAVCGLNALGRPLQEVCFRIDAAEQVLGKKRTELTTEEDFVRILISQKGARKDCKSRGYYMVLNQCDNLERLQSAARIAAAVQQKGYPNILAARLRILSESTYE
jgi:probable selenium-dependent hydroxylase accessory protein YqeC